MGDLRRGVCWRLIDDSWSDATFGLTALAGGVLADSRTGRNGWHGIVSLLRTVLSMGVSPATAGSSTTSPTGKSARDPQRCAGSSAARRSERWRGIDQPDGAVRDRAAGEQREPRGPVGDDGIDRVHDHDPPRRVVLDMDSSVSPTFGEQESTILITATSVCTCYHPLFVFNQFGDLRALRAAPRQRAHAPTDGVMSLVPVVERHKERAIRLYFRGDRGLSPQPEIYDYRSRRHALRHPDDAPPDKVLQESIAHLLKRPVRQAATRTCAGIMPASVIRPEPADKPRRVKSPRSSGIRVSSIPAGRVHCHQPGAAPPNRVVAFYNQRGTAEQWIKEGKNAIRWTRLSCRQVRSHMPFATGLIGMWKAFAELEAIGWIGPKRPRMVAVQATGCAPIVKARSMRAKNMPTPAPKMPRPSQLGYVFPPRSAIFLFFEPCVIAAAGLVYRNRR